ncbi:MAG: DUF1902 domain-containing protein [Oscillospiraceae bacterium]|nr:DUF1902 domain-containing protein [Oscillospiraceae bacterium]
MKCTAKLLWDDTIWYSEVLTEKGEDVRLTLESGSFDALVERVKVALPEMLQLNFGYTGDIELLIEAERMTHLKAVAS